ncbi:MAG: penicillin-binding protein 1B [Candidatus Dasytiphilus stammeri]
MLKIKLKKNIKNIIFTILIVPILGFVIYSFYLDNKIRNRVLQNTLNLPMIIYSRVVVLSPFYESQTKNNIIKILLAHHYRQVNNLTRPGEFIIKNNRIEIFRRKFHFPQSNEDKLHAVLIFKDERLDSIYNLYNGDFLTSIKIDPIILSILDSNNKQRLFIPLNDFPHTFISMLLATEDNNFYYHGGIDFSSMSRAMIANIKAGKIVQGGSTLTQQLVRNLFLTKQRTFMRKFKEIYMSLIMNIRYSKKKILELYLNEVYLGQNYENEIHGFALASIYYFGKPVNELNLTQQALLIGMVKGPSIYNPWQHPQLSLQRRNLVLSILTKHKIINQFQYENFLDYPLNNKLQGTIISNFPAFIQKVFSELDNIKLKKNFTHFSSSKIFTTFDPVSQQNIEQTILEQIPILRKKNHLPDLQTGVVISDRKTGAIRAIIGGSLPKFAGYNRALQTHRSIGSLVKPAIYLAALNHPDMYQLNSWLTDNPMALQLANHKIWKPRNYNHKFLGKIMLIDALVKSINIPTINLGLSLGINQINEILCDLGIQSSRLNMLPSSLLGSVNLTPLEVTQMYQTIGNVGVKSTLYTIQDILTKENKIFYQNKPNVKRVISSQAAYLTLYALQETVLRGTASTLGKTFPHALIAAKTGTTNKLRDSWIVGIDGQEVVVIWVGRDNNNSTNLYGSTGALKIYENYLLKKIPSPLFLIIPKNIFQVSINSSGNLTCNSNQIWRRIPIWYNTQIFKFCKN